MWHIEMSQCSNPRNKRHSIAKCQKVINNYQTIIWIRRVFMIIAANFIQWPTSRIVTRSTSSAQWWRTHINSLWVTRRLTFDWMKKFFHWRSQRSWSSLRNKIASSAPRSSSVTISMRASFAVIKPVKNAPISFACLSIRMVKVKPMPSAIWLSLRYNDFVRWGVLVGSVTGSFSCENLIKATLPYWLTISTTSQKLSKTLILSRST